MGTEGEKVKAVCNNCGGETNHNVLCEDKADWSEEIQAHEITVFGRITHSLIRCLGCDAVSLKRDEWFSENMDDFGNPIISTTYFPHRIFRTLPRWFKEESDLPPEIASLWSEIYVCLQNKCPQAAAMVIRATLERVFVLSVKDQGSFAKNLTAFVEAGNISSQQKIFLETTLECGHASIHRGYKPSEDDLILLVEILESVLQLTYFHKKKLAALKRKIPRRKKKT